MEKIVKGIITKVTFYKDLGTEADIETNDFNVITSDKKFKSEDVGKKVTIKIEW